MTAVHQLLATAESGDPLADAVVTELDLYGARARRVLDAGLRNGLAGLDERPPEAMGALLTQLEAIPDRVDPLVLHRGDVVSLSVPPLWFQLCSIPCALAHSYASPTVAHLTADAGVSAVTATLRLAEAGVWARQALRPGGLLRGTPGYMATVRIRLFRARARTTARAYCTELSNPVPAVTQADMARTWLGFTLISFRALAAVGIDISPEEESNLYQYWSYLAHLLGIDETLHQDVTDHTDARRLQDLLDTTTAEPDETSRAMTNAMVDAQARALAGAPGSGMSEEQVRALIHRILREALGTEGADRLGIPVPAMTDLMPLVSRLNRQARYWQTYSPASAGEARRRAVEGPGPELIAALLTSPAAQRPSATAHHEDTLAA
ncbi:oxygenase MpaB family protein [Streptomyces sp. NPDC051985]|uniref:oxygenase MpaB family protein n=1 Tax=Streptomyces sp. NPDC051985 TaxID=3155807 RepID=UPI003433AC9E